MLMLIKILTVLVTLVFALPVLADRQNLDEVMARKTRYGAASFFSGESGAYYFWQPETLAYTDTNYSTEVWRMTFKPNASDAYSNEYSTMAWSGDGSKLGFRSSGASLRVSGDPNKDGGTTPRWTVNSDGGKLRAGTTLGGGQGNDYLNWLSTEQASYLFTPRATANFSGADLDTLYKVTIDSNNAMSRQVWVSDIGGNSLKSSLIKDPITSDDKWMVLQDEAAGDWPTPNDIDSYKLYFINLQTKEVVYSWGVARGIGPVADPWGQMTLDREIMLRGSSSAFVNYPGGEPSLYAHYSNYTPHFLWKIHGAAADGGPAYEDWDGDSFGTNEEIKALDDNPKNEADGPHNPYDNGYMGHPTFDRWGHYVVGNNSQDCNDTIWGSDPTRYVRWGNNGCPGQMLLDVQNNLANPSWFDANNTNYMLGSGTTNTYVGSHSSWTGWTDYIVSMDGTTKDIYKQNYLKTNQTGKDNYQAAVFIASTESAYKDNYAAYPRPSQSPDGTKIAFSTVLFSSPYGDTNADDDYPGISVAIAYYPYPPEITAATATGGLVTVAFDWRLDQETPRGYTARGWPNEATNDPPPPRETNKFRLWRSPDKSTWTPLYTTTADIFSRYNFATGAWKGSSSWSIKDQPGDGTWYYAVTAIEHSGLESRALSNIFSITVSSGSGTGEQDTTYPAAPGGKGNFLAAYSATPSLVRYYNIYAKDGSAPSISQTTRVASIPATACASYTSCSWVDWLGNTDASTQYVVTAVDTQGNESTALTSSATHKQSPATADGQYTIAWTGTRGPDPELNPGRITIGAGPHSITTGGSGSITISP